MGDAARVSTRAEGGVGRGAHAGHNSGIAVAVLMDPAAGGFPGDPLGSPGFGGNFAVQCHGIFQNHVGGFGLNEVEKHFVKPVAFRL